MTYTNDHNKYRVAQNKPDYSTFQPSLYENLHQITPIYSLAAHK